MKCGCNNPTCEFTPLELVAESFNRAHPDGPTIDVADFMFMGQDDEGVSMFKHYMTRRYISVSFDGPVEYIGVGYRTVRLDADSVRAIVSL